MTTWTKESSVLTSFTKESSIITDNTKLLKEDSFFLLLENGFKIILARGWNREPLVTTTWIKEA